MPRPAWERYLEQHRERNLQDLIEFLKIRSDSSDLLRHSYSMERAAYWLWHRLIRAGLDRVQVKPTRGQPVVYGEWLGAPGMPTVLIYGHYDVQPVEPDRWATWPFSPVVRDGRIYARGASDDKGNLLIPVLAAEAVLRTRRRLPVNVKFLIEGEEEIGSPSMPRFLAAHRDLLACDFVLSADGGQYAEGQPGITLGCKGICSLEITVQGPRVDQHSGVHGGAVQNPLHALAHMIASLRSPDGRIQVAGFYDDVRPLSALERRQIAAVPFDEAVFRAELGVPETFGEPGYSTLERAWCRPTLEVNGMWGGHTGMGLKTVLPATAHAKLSCRLVPDQEPRRIMELLERHICAHTPPGVTVEVKRLRDAAMPYQIRADHPGNRAAFEVLTEVYGREPVYFRTGATIPVFDLFRRMLGVDTVTFAFGLDDENIHAPDEFFRLDSWERGQVAYGKLFKRLSLKKQRTLIQKG